MLSVSEGLPYFIVKENIKDVKLKNLSKIDEYLYYPEDLCKFMNNDTTSDVTSDFLLNFEFEDIFSIYNVPNLNTTSIDRLMLYLNSNNLDGDLTNDFINLVKKYRKKSNYLKYKGTRKNKSGLLINKFQFENLKKLNWPEEDMLFILFDYIGRINLNFVSEKVFEIAVKACGSKKENYKKYWKKIINIREGNETIKEMDIKNIFGKSWGCYEKIFSIDSNLFKINIIKEHKILTAYVRRYKDREKKIKIFKISVGEYVGQ